MGDFTNEVKQRRIKFSYIVVAAIVAGAIIGSGIVRHSVKWVAAGGSNAIYGLLLVWVVFFVIGLLMCDNTAMMPNRGGVYAWTRKTMGRGIGTQIGWIYLVGFMCLSVILAWLAYVYTRDAIIYFFPEQSARLGAVIFSIVIPMGFIVFFTLVFTSGIKGTTKFIVGFFTLKVTMWLTIVGISLLRYDPEVAVNTPDLDTLWSTLSVSILCLFAMNGIDAVSVIADDIHEPKKNYLKGMIIGMVIVIILYGSTVLLIMGLVGQEGAKATTDLSTILLEGVSVPPPVLYVFIVISIVGTLFINMYMVVRLTGAMAINNDFYFSNSARKHAEDLDSKGKNNMEMPIWSIIISNFVYIMFFALIFIESIYNPETEFVLYVIDQLALFPFLVVLFFIALTNFLAHRKKMHKIEQKEKPYFWTRGYVLSIFGMLAMAFIIGLQTYMMWTDPSSQLPSGPEDSAQWQFWQLLGLIFPAFMVVPGLLYWTFRGRKHALPVEGRPNKEEKDQGKERKENKKKQKKEKKRDKKEEPTDSI